MEGTKERHERALGDIKDFTRDLIYSTKETESINIRER